MTSRLDDHGDGLDERWRAGLRSDAPHVDVSGAPRRVHARVTRRRHRHRLIGALVIAGLVAAGTGIGVVLTRSRGAETLHTAGAPPSPAVIAVVSVTSEPTLRLRIDRDVVPAGLIRIDYATKGGTHWLRIDGIPASRFELRVPLGPMSGQVRLRPGRYVLYCAIPGHRDAGEQAVLTVQ